MYRLVNKPEYFYRPGQTLLRLRRESGGESCLVPTAWGASIKVNPRENIGRTIWKSGVFDLPVSEALWRLAPAASVGVDVGANIGYMTLLMATRMLRGDLHAFEPHPAIFRTLEENVGAAHQRGAAKITLHSVALSDKDGDANLFVPREFEQNAGISYLTGAPDTSGRSVTVRTGQLDSYFSEDKRIDLLKIDVEGHELSVIRGGARLLSTGFITTIIFEEHKPQDSPVFSELKGYGFQLFGLRKRVSGLDISTELSADARSFESPSFLATTDPAYVRSALRARSWHILQAGTSK